MAERSDANGEGSGRRFQLRSIWCIEGTIEEVAAILATPEDICDWWPSVALRVEVLEPGGEDHVGKGMRLHTKGVLPHSFQFLARVSRVRAGRSVELEVKGDFDGGAAIVVRQRGPAVELAFDWHIVVHHPLVASLWKMMRGLSIWNHRSIMAQGEACLQREILRRSGRLNGHMADGPPGPTFPHNLRVVRDLHSWRRSVSGWSE